MAGRPGRPIADVAADISAERARVLVAGGRYLAAHNWRRLLERVALEPLADQPGRVMSPPIAEHSALPAANRLFREGRFADAARVYALLRRFAEFDLYDRNLAMCRKREAEQRTS